MAEIHPDPFATNQWIFGVDEKADPSSRGVTQEELQQNQHWNPAVPARSAEEDHDADPTSGGSPSSPIDLLAAGSGMEIDSVVN
jgi:hypothetical protein